MSGIETESGRDVDLVRTRLRSQLISSSIAASAADVVTWLGAVQAQDYGPSQWGIGLRIHGATQASVEKAFAEGAILRTHVLRPTWHFVPAADVRWMLELTSARILTSSAAGFRRRRLDPATLARSDAVLAEAVAGGRRLTRGELREALARARISMADPLRLSFVLMHAELRGLICSGPRRGAEFTYASLPERVPWFRDLAREEAVGELFFRYIRGHGPATLADFAWWSGLTLKDARAGAEAGKGRLDRFSRGARTYYYLDPPAGAAEGRSRAHLLPQYDEYRSYRERHDVVEESVPKPLPYGYLVLLDGRVVGAWKPVVRRERIIINWKTFRRLDQAEQDAVSLAADRYGAFWGAPVEAKPEPDGR